MYVIRGCNPRRPDDYEEYIMTDPTMKNKDDQSLITHSLDKADRFITIDDAENYLDYYNIRNCHWKIIEI